jgi:carboxyl-terminal processing protease
MNKYIIGFLFLFTSSFLFGQNDHTAISENAIIDTNKVLYPTELQSKVNNTITTLLTRYHYNKNLLNDSLSSVIYDNYMKSIDNNKIYFLKSDVDEFEKYRYAFDEFLQAGNLVPAFEIFNRFKQRLNERIEYAVKRLESEFDFTIDEYIEPDRQDAEWAASVEELNDLWRKRLKNDELNSILSDKDLKSAAETITKRYQRYHKIILQYKAEDVFQLYMNAFSVALDPHTSYFSPNTSDNFQISMSNSLEGIGAQLRNDNDYTKVVRIIPGGPAAKSKLLFEDDRIVGVAQGKNGEMVDVIGWRIDDVVQLIRGKKGSLVRLEILRADATPDMPTEIIKIVRDKVKLEEQAAKKEIIDIEQNDLNFKLGVIEIPQFYLDFKARSRGDQNYSSTSSDVKKLLVELRAENVDGVIVDLRNNGGGALDEAIALTGLFIKEGPVVQVKKSDGSIEVENDFDPEIVYDGPLAVLTNRFSASASEIFSGAIQDYGRGIVIGEQTYGKGTVQSMYNLKMAFPGLRKKLGDVKFTIAKYYRVTGSSTQNLGVVPDIEYPTAIDPSEFGESSNPSALPWDMITSTNFQKYNDISSLIPELTEKHKERILKNPELQYYLEDVEESKINREKKLFSLNIDKRKIEREKAEQKRKLRDEARQKNSEMTISDKEEVSVRNIKIDDPLLEETGHILADLIILSIG